MGFNSAFKGLMFSGFCGFFPFIRMLTYVGVRCLCRHVLLYQMAAFVLYLFLEPLGPVQACNGIALPLPLPLPYRENAPKELRSADIS